MSLYYSPQDKKGPHTSLVSIAPIPTLSVIVPFFNEQEVLPEFHRRLTQVLDNLSFHSEIIYVDDGSSDQSLVLARSFNALNCQVRCIALSRNFGKESAMSAGLEHAKGEAVILIDADLQDPPECIPDMLEAWRSGADVVNMKRSTRHGESWLKRTSAAMFYKLLNRLAALDIPENVGDFRLLSARVVRHLNQLPERNRYMKGLFSWPGFKQTTLTFERDARFCGETKWNYFKLLGLAMDGLTSFSIRPLRLATIAGATTASLAFIYGAWIVFKTLAYGDPVSGYPSMMVAMLALAGVQLLAIGLLGEYIGRIFVEVKQRPLYLVDSVSEQQASASAIETSSVKPWVVENAS
ncbi:glycosyltransferase family 2 protein [Marinomonas ostreistagni]|uniref:Glycosyltransferase family 2 protein n=1 Tax=Marinomonas ostreistagni TaxID=359209 RepID=A0ABS0Z5Y5_9GAMM|nr:glycosyltransferase family 2 protein [Marinomonas ostreistagni]MBJ7549076.1 glycosyltransferase family 2 protein [Marinomonas ostreistagni]